MWWRRVLKRGSLHVSLFLSALMFLSLELTKYTEDTGLFSRINFRYALIFFFFYFTLFPFKIYFFYYFILSVFLHFAYFTVSYLLPCWTFFALSVNGWLGINFSNRKCSSRRDLFWEYILLWTSQFLAFIQLHSTDGWNARGQCLCSSQLFESMCLKWVCSPAMPY